MKKKYAEERIEERKTSISILISVLFFIGMQPVLYVFFGNWLLVAYLAGYIGAGIFSIIKTRKPESFFYYPINRLFEIIKLSAKTLSNYKN